MLILLWITCYFYPRPPRGGRRKKAKATEIEVDFYPRPPRGGRLLEFSDYNPMVSISIHALREEGDPYVRSLALKRKISIHALREEGDIFVSISGSIFIRFLSTPSARRATAFNVIKGAKEIISIHALREEGDRSAIQSLRKSMISIHALREEGDQSTSCDKHSKSNFYPRPPRGGRHCAIAVLAQGIQFLSTPSARRATITRMPNSSGGLISIHALREEGDDTIADLLLMFGKFLSTPSARRATCAAEAMQAPEMISIHALREEGDIENMQRSDLTVYISIHALREEGDRLHDWAENTGQIISIHALREEGDVLRRVWRVRLADFYPRPPRGGRPCPSCGSKTQ